MKKKNEWKMKKERSLLECLFQKRVIYTQVNWEWNIRSDIRAFDTLAFPHIYLIIHTNWGQSYVQYLFHLSYNTKAIQFHLYPCYPIFVTLPRQAISHTNLIIPLYIQTGAIAKLISLPEESFTLPLFSFEPGCSYPPSLKLT